MPSAVREYQDQLVETACNLIGFINDCHSEMVGIVILVMDHHCDTDVRGSSAIHLGMGVNRAQFYSVRLERGKLRVRSTSWPATLADSFKIVACVTARDAQIR